MTAKHYLEIKNPDDCPRRRTFCTQDTHGMWTFYNRCRVERKECVDENVFPPWCPLKKVEE